MEKLPELLAPVGSIEAFGVALNAGADAVYLGTSCFNARMRAKNFSLREIRSILKISHQQGKKVYLTLNCLIYPEEFAKLKKICDFGLIYGIDGIIIQDLGLMLFMKENYPEIPLHASTQMLAYNLDSHQILKEYGVTRVILPRELSLQEIQFLARESPLDLEIFIHGAMCFAFSGGCLFSHFLFNESGNRGLCRQVCRFNFSRKGRGFFPFAMKDLNSSALIEDIRKIPLAALKIEGRMRSLAYLDETIRNYRCLLDGRPQNLQFSFSRKMSQGYLLENSYQKLTTPFENSQIGKLIGVVVSVKNRTIQTNLEEKVGPGDSIRLLSVHDSVSDNFLIIYAESSDQLVWQLKLDHAPSEKFKNKKTVIYLINKKFDHLMTPNRLHLAATHFKDFKLSLRATAQNNSIEIRITCDYPKLEIPAFEWKYQVNQWSDKDTDPSVIIRILKETSNPVWEIESVELSTPLPLYYKELKQMKRKMLKIAIPYFQCYRAQILNQRRVNPSENTPSLSPPPFRLVEINSPSQIKPDGELDQLFFLIDLDQRAQFSHEGIDRQHFFVRLPYFIPPIQSHKMAEIIDQLNQEKWPICLTHWAQIALTHDYPHPIIGHYSLYCTNHYTHRFYRKYQVDHIMVLPLSGSYQDPSMFPATSIKRELMYFRQRLPFEQVIYKGKTFPIKKHEDYGVLYESLTEPDSQT